MEFEIDDSRADLILNESHSKVDIKIEFCIDNYTKNILGVRSKLSKNEIYINKSGNKINNSDND